MGDRSKIEWTDATWNPTTGCTRVSAGCDNCYAERLAHRLLATEYRKKLPVLNNAENRSDPFALRLWPERLSIPGSWRTSRRVFVNSMSDLFHTDVPEEFLRECFRVMLTVDRHIYQVLTKRPARALRFFRRNRDLFPGSVIPAHIWIGTSVENQKASHRIRQLRAIPAETRFLSCEPLIGRLNLRSELLCDDGTQIHWVIVGGESGPSARPIDAEWVRQIRDECIRVGVPFFFKQWGGVTPKARGRELDGLMWDEFPESKMSQVEAA